MALKCYTKPKKNGGKYTTCNKDIKENGREQTAARLGTKMKCFY